MSLTNYYRPPKSAFRQWIERVFGDELDPSEGAVNIVSTYNDSLDFNKQDAMQTWLNAHDSKYERRLSRLERAQDPPTTRGLLNMALNEVQAAMGPGDHARPLPASRVPLLLDLLLELQGRLLAAEIA